MKTIILPESELYTQAAEEIAALISKKPSAVLALSYDEILAEIYKELAKLCAAGKLSLKSTTIFQVMEFENTTLIKDRLADELILKTDADPKNFFTFDHMMIEECDKRIAELGGIDIAVLDLGYKGQFGFNEPATLYSSLCHRQKLTDSTIEKYAFLDDELPEYGVTIGINTIAFSKDILIAACGEKSSDAVFGMLYGRDDGTIPAAFLQLPLNVTVYADTVSAEKL